MLRNEARDKVEVRKRMAALQAGHSGAVMLPLNLYVMTN